MERITELLLTVEQTQDLVSGLQAEDITTQQGCKPNFFKRMKQNLKNSLDELRDKFVKTSDSEGSAVMETVTMLVKDTAQKIEDASAVVEEEAPKRMSDFEYRSYLDSIVF